MKLFALALLLTCSLAQAATLTELRPAGPMTGTYRWQCAATGFADTGITGACMERYYRSGSGRGGGYLQPIVLGTWSVTWDSSGSPTLDPTSSVSWPGCQGTQSVVTVNKIPMYLIAADPLGNELVETNCVSYLWTP